MEHTSRNFNLQGLSQAELAELVTQSVKLLSQRHTENTAQPKKELRGTPLRLHV